jgi:transposase
MSKRRKFSEAFKRGAVEQASVPGVSCAQIARELGIRDSFSSGAGASSRFGLGLVTVIGMLVGTVFTLFM